MPDMHDVTEKFQVTIHGGGAHTVILANGFGTTQQVWGSQVQALRQSYRVVTFDTAGSTAATMAAWQPSRHRRLYGFAEDLVSIVETLGLQGATYVGHSLSASAGLLAACAAPGLFSGMVFIGCSACYVNDPTGGYTGGFSEADIKSLLADMTHDYIAWANGFSPLAMGNPDRPDLAASFANSLKVMRPDVAVDALGAAFLSDHRSDALRYGKLGLPTLLLQSTNDVAVPLAAAQWLASATGGQLHVLNAQGHFPHIANPAAVTQEIMEFLQHRGV